MNMPSSIPYAMPNTPAATSSQPNAALDLRDLHTPPDISMWPPAMGWWFLLVIIIVTVITGVIALQRYRARRRYRHEALQALDTLTGNNQLTPASLNHLLKRAAQHAYGKNVAAALHGEAWQLFLQQQCPALTKKFSPTVFDTLTAGPYQKPAEHSVDSTTLSAAKVWLKQHCTKIVATVDSSAVSNTHRQSNSDITTHAVTKESNHADA